MGQITKGLKATPTVVKQTLQEHEWDQRDGFFFQSRDQDAVAQLGGCDKEK